MNNELVVIQTRRHILAALLTSPLLFIQLSSKKGTCSVAAIKDAGDFVIVNGWVLLKQDVL